ncbi:EspF repeat-containing protein, partial [Escherichia coli]|uniref:EspF repeat-containing protein n=1 Tax=Escherichia coli TaxID=562 RepID=UPI002578697C
QHLAEHGIQPARNMAEHIPPAPNWPAPTPPIQNEQSRPLPDVAQRLGGVGAGQLGAGGICSAIFRAG